MKITQSAGSPVKEHEPQFGSAKESPEKKQDSPVKPLAADVRGAASDNQPTLESVRELLLGDTLQQTKYDMLSMETKTIDQIGALRAELGDRIDRVVRALSTVNQAVHNELQAREKSIEDATNQLDTKLEDRVSFLEAKIYTVVAEMERKVTDSLAVETGKLAEKLTRVSRKVDENIVQATEGMNSDLVAFGSKITGEIGSLNTQLTDSSSELNDKVETQLSTLETTLTHELAILRDRMHASTEEMRADLRKQVDEQRLNIARSEADVKSNLKDHMQQLEGRKLNRADLGVLLHDLAARMEGDSDGNEPGSDKKAKKR